MRLKFLRLWAGAVLLAAGSWALAQGPAAPGALYVLTVTGTIDPAVAGYIKDGVAKAKAGSAAALLIRLDTPGGLLDATRDIVQEILNAPFPVIVYVSPRGARAASAGVFITLASDVAAMAPETHLGAAHPVSIGGSPLSPSPALPEKKEGGEKEEKKTDKGEKAPAGSVMEEKAVSDTAAYARTLAASKGRNADWAEKAVRESLSLTAEEALKNNVIDAVAKDQEDLLRLLDGSEVEKNDKILRLDLKDAPVVPVDMGWTLRWLHILANPNVAYLLLMLGFYALIYELASPGIGLGAAVGVVSLVLAFYSLQMLPLSYAGLALLVTGLALMGLDLLMASHGLLFAGGIICLAVGSLMLFDTALPAFRVSLEIIGGTVLGTLAFFLLVIKKVLEARKLPAVTGKEGLVGQEGEVREGGMVFLHGEYWTAESEKPLSPGDKVRVTEIKGNRLKVEKI